MFNLHPASLLKCPICFVVCSRPTSQTTREPCGIISKNRPEAALLHEKVGGKHSPAVLVRAGWFAVLRLVEGVGRAGGLVLLVDGLVGFSVSWYGGKTCRDKPQVFNTTPAMHMYYSWSRLIRAPILDHQLLLIYILKSARRRKKPSAPEVDFLGRYTDFTNTD